MVLKFVSLTFLQKLLQLLLSGLGSRKPHLLILLELGGRLLIFRATDLLEIFDQKVILVITLISEHKCLDISQ
jgi:hypothetical protein